jgi:threonine/homoserine/homoserine lactone efflux protein
MAPDHLAVLSYALVMAMTPGPTTVVLALSGATFGFRRTLPHAAGAVAGYAVQVALAGLGLGLLLARIPWLAAVLQWACALYLVELGRRMLVRRVHASAAAARPLPLVTAAVVQLANPKSWIMATTSATLLAVDGAPASILALLAWAVVPTAPCMAAWAWFGAGVQRRLATPLAQRTFRASMALLLVGTAVLSVAR